MSATTADPPAERGLLTIPEAARRLGIHVRTLRQAISRGQVRAVELASVRRIPLAEVERLLAAAKS